MSIYLKHTSYHTNGTGRDLYIYSDNGGYLKKTHTSSFDPMSFGGPQRNVVTLPSIPSKTVHYGPDGTGRDTYIKTDEGGIFPNFSSFSPKRRDFINSLRFYQPQRKLESRDFFCRSQLILPTKEVYKLRQQAKVQKALTKRLTSLSVGNGLPTKRLPSITEQNKGSNDSG